MKKGEDVEQDGLDDKRCLGPIVEAVGRYDAYEQMLECQVRASRHTKMRID